MSNRKVVITGIGMVTPCGNGTAATWEAVKAGKSGIGRITKFDPSRCTSQVAGEVKDFDEYVEANGLIDRKAARHMALFSRYAVASAVEAWRDSGFAAEGAAPDMDRVGVMIGNGVGGIDITGDSYKILFDRGPDRLSPLAVPELIANEAAGNVSIALGAKGPSQVVVTACASSTDAVGFALDMIRAGRADIVVAGGCESAVLEFCVAGFMKMRALSTKYNETPERACRPFNADRDGFIIGEGSAVLVLETEESAKARGARIYCELAGYAYHITAPDPSGAGAVKAIKAALADADVQDPSEIDYVNAHGTSTPLNDVMETRAFKAVWGEEGAKKLKISSTKSMTGHLLGGTGALEAAFCALAIRDGFVPPTINYETPDPECDLDYTPNKGVEMPIRAAVSTSLGFGGHNGALVFKKV